MGGGHHGAELDVLPTQGGPLSFSPSSVYAEDGDRGLRAAITYSLLAGTGRVGTWVGRDMQTWVGMVTWTWVGKDGWAWTWVGMDTWTCGHG